MAVYLYNLGFSASNAVNGNFSSGGSGIDTSNAWFEYVGSATPGTPEFSPVAHVAPASNWQAATPPTTFNAGSDYVLLRIFNSDNNPAGYLVRTTAIFGQGNSASFTPVTNLQAPFVMGSYARPVIDCDPSSATSWPAPVTDINPVTSASSWTYCLGLVRNPSGQIISYQFNVGASVYEIATGNIYAFGIDPKMKVGGTGMMTESDEDAA